MRHIFAASQKKFQDEIDAGHCASAEIIAFSVLCQRIDQEKAPICSLVV